MSSCSLPGLKIATASDVFDRQWVCPCEKAQIYLPICVSLHLCGTATVPPTSKTVRAKSVATVNTADFSPELYIKFLRTLWEESGTGPKREQVSSISPPPPEHQRERIGCLPEMCASTCGPKNQSLSVSPDSVFCLWSRRQTRSSEHAAGNSADPGPVWQHVHSHLSLGHHPLRCPLLWIHPPPSEGCSACAALSKQHLQIQMEHPCVLLIVHELVRTSRWEPPPGSSSLRSTSEMQGSEG